MTNVEKYTWLHVITKILINCILIKLYTFYHFTKIKKQFFSISLSYDRRSENLARETVICYLNFYECTVAICNKRPVL